jgi:hypothetical protein
MKKDGEVIREAIGIKCRSAVVVESLESAPITSAKLTLETLKRGRRAA